ncbi:MAG: acyl-[ACP]--phospholipid O-acyltransferase [Syntrophobacterales bacterium]|jgi:acyl-[acyl-carrier-protein]-phospholipid O-acyltransferase/long-chain-fatty-acid--[acyl-carrier-protein] ligase|nr:acyl-[ACP]--phospholipid O-acyltransferase [Syntrophobacterales bacterium]
MPAKGFGIFKKQAFSAVFVTQFLGAFNDNLFRATFSGFVMYKLVDISAYSKQLITSLAVGLFMLPFLLFSALAGEITDKYRKDLIFKILKLCEVIIVSLAVCGFVVQNPIMLLAVLFLMGAHSAFFGPAKYSILPDILKEKELLAGNGFFEAGTYLAILQGTIIGGLIMSGEGSGLFLTSIFIVSVAVTGLIASLFIPNVKAAAPQSEISFNFLKSTFVNMKFAAVKREILLCILGLSWFWLVGAVLISQIPGFSRNVLNADGNVYTFLLTLFSCGIGVGAIWCQSLLKGEISGRYVPISSILMTIFLLDLAFSSLGITVTGDVQTLDSFLTSGVGIRISLDLFLLAVCGGLFIVPLNAMLQIFAEDKIRSRVIATNNIINALFMVAGSGVCAFLLSMNLSIANVFLCLAVANAFVAIYICGLLPEHLIRSVVLRLLKVFYKVEVAGLNNFKKLPKEAVIVANHTSFLDVALMWAYLPGVFFAVNSHVAKQWWMRPLLHLVKHFPIDPLSPMAVKSIINEVKQGKKVVVFPEGRITTTGGLMKVYPGSAMIVSKTEAPILPVYIDGSQYSIFGHFARKFKKRPTSRIKMNILPPQKMQMNPDLFGKAQRLDAAAKLYAIMAETKYKSTIPDKSLFEGLVDAFNLVGGKKKVLEDLSRKPLSFASMMTGIFTLGKAMANQTRQGEYVGLMLPGSNAAVVAFFGMHAYGRIPCMINFSGGVKSILASVKAVKIKTVYTSFEFIQRAHLGEVVAALETEGIKVISLEDVKKEIGFWDKAAAFAKAQMPLRYAAKVKPDDAAVVMFTSGSEGLPKGVVLSHRNIQANRAQFNAVADIGLLDSFFNAMPIFHAFGLTVGMLLPLLGGVKVFMYPSPLHYKIVPELIYDTNSTVMFGTDTFLRGYAKAAHPYDFYSIRFTLVGAEKVKEETFKTWFERFGVRLFEGYGATETAPILSLNLPMNFKLGTVGRLLPGIESRLEKVPGVENGGRLFVKGQNIMKGYLKPEQPGILQTLDDGWYDTGDIVNIDNEGFVKILGRAKRFAKIAGEMVSLSAVETEISAYWSDGMHAAVAVPDDRKGEQLILFTTNKEITRLDVAARFKSAGISELAVPKQVVVLDTMPIIGTGKTDYVKLNEEAAKEL